MSDPVCSILEDTCVVRPSGLTTHYVNGDFTQDPADTSTKKQCRLEEELKDASINGHSDLKGGDRCELKDKVNGHSQLSTNPLNNYSKLEDFSANSHSPLESTPANNITLEDSSNDRRRSSLSDLANIRRKTFSNSRGLEQSRSRLNDPVLRTLSGSLECLLDAVDVDLRKDESRRKPSLVARSPSLMGLCSFDIDSPGFNRNVSMTISVSSSSPPLTPTTVATASSNGNITPPEEDEDVLTDEEMVVASQDGVYRPRAHHIMSGSSMETRQTVSGRSPRDDSSLKLAKKESWRKRRISRDDSDLEMSMRKSVSDHTGDLVRRGKGRKPFIRKVKASKSEDTTASKQV